ncbi:MAG: hypothetical protein DME05_11360, partial [Candidatus Rokuibacteriota bacterium]
PCAELCGFGHSGMRGWIYVHTADEYAKWAAQNLTAEAAPTTEAKPDDKADAKKEAPGKAEPKKEGKAKK